MPVFNWNAFHTPDPAQHIRRHGLRVQAEIFYHPEIEQHLIDHGVQLPAPFTGWGIIDTGATATMISSNVVRHLNLVPIGKGQAGVVGGTQEANLYAFRVTLATGLGMNCVPGMGTDLPAGIDALIGMDLLAHCIMVLNGPGGMVSIAI